MLQENQKQKYRRHRIKVSFKIKICSNSNTPLLKTFPRRPGQSLSTLVLMMTSERAPQLSDTLLPPLCSRHMALHADEHSGERAVDAAVLHNIGPGHRCCVRQHVPPDTGDTY